MPAGAGECELARCRIKGETNWTFRGDRGNPYEAEQKALIDAVRRNQPLNSGNHMATSTMVTVLGQLACYTGKAMRGMLAEIDKREGKAKTVSETE